jgi:phenylalanyl-tRNA synthetase alpha chain
MPAVLTPAELAAALSLRDLTDPAQGPHALQLLIAEILAALPGAHQRVVRAHPVVPVADNYDHLGYAAGAVTRDARYTRYAGPDRLLRSHTSAMVPPALRRLAAEPAWTDVLLACPGIVYRRDAIDRLRTGTPHQLDLWRLRTGTLTGTDLDAMIATVLAAALPGAQYRAVPASHPYTTAGRQLDVLVDGEWVEVGECGLAATTVLRGAGLPAQVTGLAMGLGLERLLMLRKGIPDIRLITATEPRVAAQLLDLAPYRPVSHHPPITRDLSLAVAADTDADLLGDAVRAALGADADAIESLEVRASTPVSALPPAAVARLGARPDQCNVLLRVVLRHPTRTLTDAEANEVRDRVYASLHDGTAYQWAGVAPS